MNSSSSSKTIGIIGLGLIGGSLALDLYQKGHHILGISRAHQSCRRALERKACHQVSSDMELVRGADLIFLCTPIGSIISTLEAILPYVSASTILTDVASVKGVIVEKCSMLCSNFIGGHPMAGNARTGIEAAQYNLFRNAPYVLTPIETTSVESLEVMQDIIAELGAITYISDPYEHDRSVSWISHLPVMVSAALLESVNSKAEPEILELAKNLASSGFRDTTRIGGGNPQLGLMMAQYNQEAILDSLINYQQVLQEITDHIRKQDWISLETILQRAHAKRPDFLRD